LPQAQARDIESEAAQAAGLRPRLPPSAHPPSSSTHTNHNNITNDSDTTTAPGRSIIPPGFRVQQEGAARILLPTAPLAVSASGSGGKKAKGGVGGDGGGASATTATPSTDSFYNPAQVTNRDLSVAAIRVFLRMRERDIAEGRLRSSPSGGAAGGGGKKSARGPKSGGTTGHNTARRVAEAAAAAAGVGGGNGEQPEPAFDRPGGPVRILEGMAASGIRSIRYALELDGSDEDDDDGGAGERPPLPTTQPQRRARPPPRTDRRRPLVDEVHANDLDPSAVDDLRRNLALNGPVAQRVVKPLCSDVRAVLLYAGAGASASSLCLSPAAAAAVPSPLAACAAQGGYTVVDLDPYGAPTFLLDAAVQSVSDGGMMAVTATDTAVLCGNHGEVAWGKYGCYPLHRPYGHEGAVRVLLACLEAHAARHKRTIEPLLSLSIDFYVRVFVRVRASAEKARASASRQAYVWQSAGCDSFWVQKCGDRIERGGAGGGGGGGPGGVGGVATAAAAGGARGAQGQQEQQLQGQEQGQQQQQQQQQQEAAAAAAAAAAAVPAADHAAAALNKKGRPAGGVKYTPGHGPAVPSVTCPDTGARMLMGGPYWADAIHDPSFVTAVMEELTKARSRRRRRHGRAPAAAAAAAAATTADAQSPLQSTPEPLGGALGGYAAEARVRGMLSVAREELPDAPLYYDLHSLAKTLRCTAPPLAVLRSALLNAGHRVSGSHACPLAVKTTAPPEVVWDILRCWVRDRQPLARPPDPDSAAGRILRKAPSLQADFTRAALAVPASAAPGAAPRFVQNPAFWGPRARHGKGVAAVPASGALPLPKDLRRRHGGGGERDAGGAGGGGRDQQREQQQQRGQLQQPEGALPAELEAAAPEDQLAGLYGIEAGGGGDDEKDGKRPRTA
jgi:tRNA(guanine-26,N2-N2) methyltransferase